MTQKYSTNECTFLDCVVQEENTRWHDLMPTANSSPLAAVVNAANHKAVTSMELFLKCFLILLSFQMETSLTVIVPHYKALNISGRTLCRLVKTTGVECGAPHVWRGVLVTHGMQKGIAGGVQTERAMGNTLRRSEVKIHEERQISIELATEDPLTGSTQLFHWEHDFCQAPILEAVVLLKFMIPP